MTNKEMDQKIRAAFTEATPDVLGSVLADCKKQPKPTIQFSSPMANWGKKFTLTVAAAALVICLSLGWNWGLFGVGPTIPTGPFQTGTSPSEPSDPNQTEPVNPAAKTLYWTLYGALVDANGVAGEKVELQMKLKTWKPEEGPDQYSASFDYPADTVHYSVSGVLPKENAKYPYTTSYGIGYEKGIDANVPYSAYLSLDLEKECVIIDFDDDQDVYLVASTDPNADIGALWQHLQGFFELRPDGWPTVTPG